MLIFCTNIRVCSLGTENIILDNETLRTIINMFVYNNNNIYYRQRRTT